MKDFKALLETCRKLPQKLATLLGEKHGQKESAHVIDLKRCAQKMDFDFPSFSAILPYRYYDEKDELFINEHSIGFGLEIGVLAGADEKMMKSFSDFFRFKFEDGYDIQFILSSSNKVGAQLENRYGFDKSPSSVYKTLHEISLRYYEKAAKAGFQNRRGLPLTLRDYRAFCFVSKKTSYKHRAVEKLLALRTTIEAEFRGAELAFLRLNALDFITLLYMWLNPSKQMQIPKKRYDEHEFLAEQVVDSSFELIHDPDHLTISTSQNEQDEAAVLVNLSMNQLPDEFALWMFPDNFFNILRSTKAIACPFLITLSARLIPHDQAKNKAQRKFLSYQNKVGTAYAKLIAGTEETAQEWKKIRDDLDKENTRMAKLFFNVLLFSDQANYKDDQAAAGSSFRFNGIELCTTKYMQLQSYLASLPFFMSEGLFQDLENVKRIRKVKTWNLASLLPIVADYKASRTGVMLPTFRNQIAFYNPYDESLGITNYNIAVAATSGSGKSFLVQMLLLHTLSIQGKVFVIDVGDSYRHTCELLGGTYLTADSLKLNPFTFVTEIDEACEKIRDLFAILASPKGRLSEVQLTHLLEAVILAWEHHQNEACVDDVVFELLNMHQKNADDRLNDLVILLKKYGKDGPYGKIFNSPSDLSPDAQLIVCELGGLSERPDLMKAVLFAQILTIEELIYGLKRSIPKQVILDEAWRFLKGDNEQARQFLEKGLRTGRKHKTSFVTITQSVNDYHQSTEAEAVWNCSDTKIILRQDAKAFEDFIKNNPEFYSPYIQRVIKSFGAAKENGFSEFMLQIGPISSFHRLFADPFSRIMASSAAEHVDGIKHYLDQGLPLDQAILNVAQHAYPEEFDDA